MLQTFILSSVLLFLSSLDSVPIYFTISGLIGCTLSANLYISDFINYKEKKMFINCNLINKNNEIPILVNKIDTDEKTELIYSIPSGLCFEDFLKKESSISSIFQKPVKIKQCDNYNILFEITKCTNLETYIPIKLQPYEILCSKKIKINMNKFPHCLISGDTGSGKSRLLLTILTNLIYNHENIDIYLLQLRKNDLGVFKTCKQVKAFSFTIIDILENLILIDNELQRREKLIDNYRGIYNIEDYNKKYKNSQLEYAYVVIDEFSFLNVSKGDSKEEKAIKHQCLKYIKNIVNIGRACGIFLITSLQKPTADSIPSDIKSQLTTRISMKILDMQSSLVMLGTDEATKLREREVFVKTNKPQIDFTFEIEHSIIKKYIKDSIVNKPPKSTTNKSIKSNINKNNTKPTNNQNNKISLL